MNKIIEIAKSFAGNKDNPIYRDWFYGEPKKGNTLEIKKYNDWLSNIKKAADCAVFCSYCYNEAGFPLGKGDFLNGWASVPNALKHYTTTNEITKFPQSGDLVIMGWDGKTPRHMGLFIENLGNGTIRTIEANTSNPNDQNKSEDNGGWTMEKIRPNKFILAYIHPKVLDNTSEETIKERLA